MKVILVKCVSVYVWLGATVSKVLAWRFWKLHLFKSSEKARGSKFFHSVKLLCVNSASACLLDGVLTFSMFLPLLDMIERAIINTFVGHDVVEPGNYVQMFPYPCYTRDE